MFDISLYHYMAYVSHFTHSNLSIAVKLDGSKVILFLVLIVLCQIYCIYDFAERQSMIRLNCYPAGCSVSSKPTCPNTTPTDFSTFHQKGRNFLFKECFRNQLVYCFGWNETLLTLHFCKPGHHRLISLPCLNAL